MGPLAGNRVAFRAAGRILSTAESLGERRLKGVEPMALFRLLTVADGAPAVSARHPVAPNLAFEEALAPLRGDPRFEGLKRRMDLPG